MIQFNDLTYNSNGVTGFFLPMRLRMMLLAELRRQNIKIQYTLVSYRRIQKQKDLTTQYAPYQKAAYDAFTKSGYDATMSPDYYDLIITDIEPNYLFKKLKLFYGNTMDADMKDTIQSETYPVKDETTDKTQIPVSADLFDIIGTEEDLQDLAALMKAKNLTEEDCETILHAICLKVFTDGDTFYTTPSQS